MSGPRRQGMALPLVLVVLAVAGALIAATSFLRRHASRDVAALLQRQEAFAIAEAAVREVCQRKRLRTLLTTERARLTTAFARGEWHAPLVVKPASLDIEVSPSATRRRVADDPTVQVSEVRLEILEYRQGIDHQGTLRGAVWVRRKLGDRTVDYRLALDYPIRLSSPAGLVWIEIPSEPKARVTA